MPNRAILAREIAELLKVMAHPDRVRLIEELRNGSLDVTDLSTRLGIPPTRVSQHLALMKAHRVVADRPDGRHHLYSLVDRNLAGWLLDGAKFVHARAAAKMADRQALDAAAILWRDGPSTTASETAAKLSNGEKHG
ncbi:MAG: metalloregulator ArsR/SmtB family transcription factor [Parvularculaceae bacterium]|nr:metalloregulator ArsR/SmtB family transcription factor [Parvularculaceae bacterium]